MTKIAIIGCGVVGAAIAYELSLFPHLQITVFDAKSPASGSTGAALGVLMGAISHKIKGRAWRLREESIKRYDTLIPELTALTGLHIPFNRQGILMLLFAGDDFAGDDLAGDDPGDDPGDDIERWEKLVDIRRSQDWNLQIWNQTQLQQQCPHIENERVIGAIYSPQDRQVDPVRLTQAFVAGAAKNGVEIHFGVKVENFVTKPPNGSSEGQCCSFQVGGAAFEFDWLVIAAGNGSTPLTASLKQPVDIRPVLGQALQIQLDSPLGKRNFQPVITGDDVHIVPLGRGQYWLGATVEFPDAAGEVVENAQLLAEVKKQAESFCPSLANATVLRTWSGCRPRPNGQPAPLIQKLPGYDNVLLATGHYRNGILLAPATAQAIRQMII